MPSYSLKKLTECKWANLYEIFYNRNGNSFKSWIMCSRKNNPVVDADIADAVVIIPFIKSMGQIKLVLTKEFRIPIWDYEYGFPAGLIDKGETVDDTIKRELKEETGLEAVKTHHISPPVYSTAGLSDESCFMAIVQAQGQLSNQYLHTDEDIEPLICSADEVKEILKSNSKIAAKAWGIMYYFAATGKIPNVD